MRKRLLSVPAMASVLALTLAACGGEADADAGGAEVGETSTQIQVTGTDALEFDPTAFSVPAGEEVTVELTAESGVEHDFLIDDVDGDEQFVVHADPGETASRSFTVDEAGSYTFFCGIPGHREAGMEGTLEVVDS